MHAKPSQGRKAVVVGRPQVAAFAEFSCALHASTKAVNATGTHRWQGRQGSALARMRLKEAVARGNALCRVEVHMCGRENQGTWGYTGCAQLVTYFTNSSCAMGVNHLLHEQQCDTTGTRGYDSPIARLHEPSAWHRHTR